MDRWVKICLLLCLFGLLKELRPSEFFVTEYLTGPWKNFTLDEVYSHFCYTAKLQSINNNDIFLQIYTIIFPVWTYSYLALLVVVFLVTDYLLYKPVIILEGIFFILTWCTLIWGQTLSAMQVFVI